MAKVSPGLDAPRSISSRERVIMYFDRGRWLMRKWPRKRGNWGTLKQINQVQWFKDTTAWIKHAVDSQYLRAMEIASGTKLYPRDVLMKAAAGNLYEIYEQDGTPLPAWKPEITPVAFQGIRLVRTSNLAVAASTATAVTWQSAIMDTAGQFTVGTPTRINIVTGINVVEFTAGFQTSGSGGAVRQMVIRDQSGNVWAINQDNNDAVQNGTLATGPIPVAPGLWFEFVVFYNVARTLAATPATFFSCEILDAS